MTVWLHNPKSTLLGDLLRAKAGDANTKGTLLVCAPEGEGFSEQTLSVGNLRSGRKGARILRALEVNNRDEAAALNGWRILIPSESLPALGSDNEFYFHEIEGAAVVLASGKSLGFVRRVVETSCEVLEIERLDGNELLVPVLHETVESFGPPVVLFDHVLEWFDLHASQDDELLSKQGNVEGDES
jgi:16S rRNA processing protein RimM